MSYLDVFIAERLMERNVAEGVSAAEVQRLARALQPERQSVLIRLGRLLQGLGRHLERYSPAPTPELQQKAGSS
jgi:hypothetical protein